MPFLSSRARAFDADWQQIMNYQRGTYPQASTSAMHAQYHARLMEGNRRLIHVRFYVADLISQGVSHEKCQKWMFRVAWRGTERSCEPDTRRSPLVWLQRSMASTFCCPRDGTERISQLTSREQSRRKRKYRAVVRSGSLHARPER